MQTRPCVKSDIVSINKWLKRRGHPEAISEQLPKTGFIVPGVAVGFIRKAEGIGIFEALASNPLVSPPTRNKALSSIFKQMENVKGISHIIGMTKEEDVLLRAIESGYNLRVEYRIIIKKV